MVDNADDKVSDTPELLEQLEDASNILVKAPAFSSGKTHACRDLLSIQPAAALNALVFTYYKSAERWLSAFQKHEREMPHNMVVVSVGDSMRATTTRSDSSGIRPLTPNQPVIDTVSSPADLTGIGIKITEYLRAFENTQYGDGPGPTAICFDSLTALLQYTTEERAFRFLHTLTMWVRQSNATAHYHIDPTAHDTQTIATLEPLFDATLDATAGTESAEWILHTA